MKVADYIMSRLSEASLVTGVYGSACADFFDARERGIGPKIVHVIHEQSAGFAAEGATKSAGRWACAVATSGPGATNLVTPMANCYYDSVPVLFLTGNSPLPFQRPHSSVRQSGFQECPITDVARPVVKHACVLRDPQDARLVFERALHAMLEGRPGPALVDVPADVQKADVVAERLAGYAPPPPVQATRHDVDVFARTYAEALAKAERPCVLVGGGARGAGALLDQFLDRTKQPAFPTWNALDVVTSDHPQYGGRVGTYGGPGRNLAFQQADLVLVLGSRVSGRITGGATSAFLRGADVFWVDVDGAVLEHTVFDRSVAAALTTRVEDALPMIHEKVTSSHSEWLREAQGIRDRYPPGKSGGEGVNPYAFVEALSGALPANAVITSECGGNAAVVHQAFRTKLGQRLFSSHGHSPMGGGLAYGIGAALACPNRPVHCVVGDGGLAAAAHELLSLRVHRDRLRNLRVWVLNNGIFGITRQYERTNLSGRFVACGPEPESGYAAPDFGALCRAHGVSYRRCADCDVSGIPVWSVENPMVVDVLSPGWDYYEPRISGHRPIEEMTPSIPADEFESVMRYVPPVEGWKERR